jgi:hypothetical protein
LELRITVELDAFAMAFKQTKSKISKITKLFGTFYERSATATNDHLSASIGRIRLVTIAFGYERYLYGLNYSDRARNGIFTVTVNAVETKQRNKETSNIYSTN